MANTTRIQLSQNMVPYIRLEASAPNDHNQADVPHKNGQTQNLGTSVDALFHSDANTTWNNISNDVVLTSTTAAALSTSVGDTNLILIHIKHSGYQDSDKTLKSADDSRLRIYMANTATKFIGLYPGEAITFHDFGTGTDNTTDWLLSKGTSENVYAEVTSCSKADDGV